MLKFTVHILFWIKYILSMRNNSIAVISVALFCVMLAQADQRMLI